MSCLHELSLSVLLGLDRNPARMPDLPEAASEIVARIQVAGDKGQGAGERAQALSDENAVLSVAGLLAIYEQSGFSISESDTDVPEPCPQETKPVWDTPAANVLFQSVLELNTELFLSECFRLLAARQRIAPLFFLPRMLDICAEKPNLRTAVQRVMGNRGRWLAQMNPAWRGFLINDEVTDLSLWEEGSLAERIRFLESIRQKDSAQGRELLTQVFSGEPAQNRSSLLAALSCGLSPDDEPFLSAALNDRSREVARTAAKLLSLIPESELCRNVREIMRGCVSPEKKLLRQKLSVEAPEFQDDELKKLGISATMKFGSKIGTKAGLLVQLTALTPLLWWEKEIIPDPAACIQAGKRSDWKDALMLGWIQAAVNQGNSDWAAALFETSKDARESLITVLSDEHFEQIADRAFRSFNKEIQAVVHLILPEAIRRGKPLSIKLSECLIEALREIVTGGSTIWELRNRFKDIACLIHPSMLERAAERWPRESEYRNYFQEAGTNFSEIIRLRRKLYEELGL
jgi:hypothetical protein